MFALECSVGRHCFAEWESRIFRKKYHTRSLLAPRVERSFVSVRARTSLSSALAVEILLSNLREWNVNGLKWWNNATRPSSEGNINGTKVFSFPVEMFPRKTFSRRSSLDFKSKRRVRFPRKTIDEDASAKQYSGRDPQSRIFL